MKTEQSVSRRPLDYGVGALVTLVISVGVAVVAYSASIITFNLFNIPAWIFGPFGAYTIIYSFVADKDPAYYLVWGTIMFAVAIVSALYNVISPFIVFGILIIIIAIIGLVTYRRGRE